MLFRSRHPRARLGGPTLGAVHDVARALELLVVFLLQPREVAAALSVPLRRALPLLAGLAGLAGLRRLSPRTVLAGRPGLLRRIVSSARAFGRLLRVGDLLLEAREAFTGGAQLVELIGDLLRVPLRGAGIGPVHPARDLVERIGDLLFRGGRLAGLSVAQPLRAGPHLLSELLRGDVARRFAGGGRRR